MSKFVQFDSISGAIQAFYSEDINGTNIPSECIEISDNIWKTLLCNQGAYIVDLTKIPVVNIIENIDDLFKINPPKLEDVQNDKKNEINLICQERIYSGFYSYAEGEKDINNNPVALLYKYDDAHRLNISALYTLALQHKSGLLLNYPCKWKQASLENEVCHEISDDMAIQIYFDMLRHVEYNKLLSDTLIQQVMSCTTVEDVNNINFPDASAEPLPPLTLS